jgi:hypothetical protein
MRCLAVAFALAAVSAGAEEAERGFYAGADVAGVDASAAERYGLLFGTPQSFFLSRPDVASTGGVDVSWGAHLGYRVSRILAFELGYTDFGTMVVHETYDLSPLIPVIDERTATFGVSGPSLSWLGRIPAGDHFEAYVRVGVLHAAQELHRGFGSPPRPNTDDAVPLFGIGGSYDLTDTWSIRLEFQHVGKLRGRGVGGDPGSIGPIRIRRYGLGASWRF